MKVMQRLPNANTAEQANPVSHGAYFPHIDGIRAFAVLPVVLFHILAHLCPGGFSGVDVFFVISGYLITGGVLRDLANGQFTIANFYHRRIRRILPAYFTLIAGVFAIGCVILYALPLMYLGDAAVMGTLFSANIYFSIFSGNYFATDIQSNPLLHLWSLSVEEQFYLIIPLFCAVVWKFHRRLVAPALALLAVLSLSASIYAVATGKQNGAFYLLHFRAWELLAGALLAMLPPLTVPTAGARHRSLLPAAGLLLVVTSYAVLSSTTPFPGAAALPLVLGTALLIRYGQTGWVARLLCWRPFIFVGRISYSLYLWHWPIIVFWRYATYDQLTAWDYAGMFLLSLLLSWLSWKYVELPVRLAKTWQPRRSFAFAATGIFLLVTIGLWCACSKGWPTVLHPAANAMSAVSDFPSRIPRSLFVMRKRLAALSGHTIADPYWQQFGAPGDYSLGAPGRNPELLLMGDSHAGVLQYGLDILLRDADRGGIAISRAMVNGGTVRNRPSTNLFDMRNPECTHALAVLSAHPEVTRVLLVQNWGSYLNSPSQYDLLEEFANHIRAMKKTLFITAVVPQRDHSPSDIAARTMILSPRHPEAGWEDGRQSEAAYENENGTLNTGLLNVCRKTGAVFVPVNLALKQNQDYIAFTRQSGKIVHLYKDLTHLSREGSLLASTYIMPYLFPKVPSHVLLPRRAVATP